MKKRASSCLLISTFQDFERLLKRRQIRKKHINCYFQRGLLKRTHLIALKEHQIQTVRFFNTDVIYPSSPLTQFCTVK